MHHHQATCSCMLVYLCIWAVRWRVKDDYTPRARTEPSPAKTKISVEMNSAKMALMVSGWAASSALPNAYLRGGMVAMYNDAFASLSLKSLSTDSLLPTAVLEISLLWRWYIILLLLLMLKLMVLIILLFGSESKERWFVWVFVFAWMRSGRVTA